MAAVPSERTSLEQRLATELWQAGLRGWRRHQRILDIRPDFIFRRSRVVVFVDGCFWHRCPECAKRPATNTGYWDAKLARNAARDARQAATLRRAGWRVLRFWGHQIEADVAACVFEVATAVRAPEDR